MPQDSPLSITASVTGILTFVVAVALGFYARALSLREALRIDYRIIEAVAQYSQNLNSAVLVGKFVEESLKQSRPQDHDDTVNLRGAFVEMFALELTSCIRLLLLLNSSRIQRLEEWENTRRQVLQRSNEAAALKSRITYIQTMMISRNMDRKVDDVLDGLRRVEYCFVEELNRVQKRLINPDSLSRPRSPAQNSENQQPVSSSPTGAAAHSIAEEQPIPLDTTTHSSNEKPSTDPNQDDKNQQLMSSSLGAVYESSAEEKPLTKSSLHTSAGSPSTQAKQSAVSTVTALHPAPLVSAALPPSPYGPGVMYSEAWCLAKERSFGEVGEFDILLRSRGQPLFDQIIQEAPDKMVAMLIKLSQSIIHETLFKMENPRWKTHWVIRGQQQVLNCFC